MSLTIEPGNYQTRDGTVAHVWEATTLHGRDAWKGTVTDGGMTLWESDGTEAFGAAEWDLMDKVLAAGEIK